MAHLSHIKFASVRCPGIKEAVVKAYKVAEAFCRFELASESWEEAVDQG